MVFDLAPAVQAGLHTVYLIAGDPTPPANLSTSGGGLLTWMSHNIVGLVLVFIGIVALGLSRKGNHSELLSIAGGVIVALAIVAMGAEGLGLQVGGKALALVLSA